MLTLQFKNKLHPNVAISEKRTSIGRDKSNMVVLDDDGISAFHAELHTDNGKFQIIDIGSSNGTYVNEVRVNGRSEVNLWDLIRLDFIQFELVDTDKVRPTNVRVAISDSDIEAANTDQDPSKKSSPARTTVIPSIRPKLTGKNGIYIGRTFDLKLPATVGRGVESSIVIDDDTVSTKHAIISDDGSGWRVDDCESTNGTFVNNARVKKSQLINGDKIRFGVIEMVFDTGAPTLTKTVSLPNVENSTKTTTQLVKSKNKVPGWAYGLASFILVGSGAFAYLNSDKINLRTTDQIEAPLQAGQTWVQRLPNERSSPSTPIVADINGDKILDVVVGDAHGFLTAFDGGTGKQIFELDVGDRILASLATADLTGHGTADIIVGTNTGNIVAVNGKGLVLWKASADLDLGQIVNRPVLQDINGDKIPDVIVPTMGKGLVALDGSRGWKIWDTSGITKGKVITSPLALDLNGDGVMDFLVVTDLGEVLAFTTQGKTVLQLWKAEVPKVTYASPTYSKVNKTGVVIVATEAGIIAMAADTGRQVWQTKKPANFFASPVAASLNGDDVPDVVAVSTDGNVFAYDGKNGDEIWTLSLGVGVKASPALFEFNADKSLDIVILDETGGVHIIDGNRGRLLYKTQIAGAESFIASPVLADINGDGNLDLGSASSNGQIAIYSFNRQIIKNSAPWPIFLGNDWHSVQ